MKNLDKLSMEELVDILSEQTSLSVQMHIEGASEKEFQKCRLLLQAVQAEIRSRRESNSKQDQENGELLSQITIALPGKTEVDS